MNPEIVSYIKHLIEIWQEVFTLNDWDITFSFERSLEKMKSEVVDKDHVVTAYIDRDYKDKTAEIVFNKKRIVFAYQADSYWKDYVRFIVVHEMLHLTLSDIDALISLTLTSKRINKRKLLDQYKILNEELVTKLGWVLDIHKDIIKEENDISR